MSLTTGYKHERLGGNFYYAKYGVLVKQAPNTFVIHKANDFHGTTVHEQDYKPEKRGVRVKQPQVCHRGFSLLIPPNLKKTYNKSRAANYAQVDSQQKGVVQQKENFWQEEPVQQEESVQRKEAALEKPNKSSCVITGRIRKSLTITTREDVLAKVSQCSTPALSLPC